MQTVAQTKRYCRPSLMLNRRKEHKRQKHFPEKTREAMRLLQRSIPALLARLSFFRLKRELNRSLLVLQQEAKLSSTEQAFLEEALALTRTLKPQTLPLLRDCLAKALRAGQNRAFCATFARLLALLEPARASTEKDAFFPTEEASSGAAYAFARGPPQPTSSLFPRKRILQSLFPRFSFFSLPPACPSSLH